MDRDKMFKKIEIIQKKSHRSKIRIILDLFWCGIRYQAGYMDYLVFEFYHLNNIQRRSYVTTGINNKYAKSLNSKDSWNIFDKKNLFNEKFKKYLGRDCFFTDNKSHEEIINWFSNKDIFIAKPHNGMCGVGVTKIEKSQYKSKYALLKYLKLNNLNILEEYVNQHEAMNKLHPNSVNTIRLITILKDNKLNIIASFLRIGNGSSIDNFNNGGMTCPIDIKTGEVNDVAVDKNGFIYKKHPLTNEKIVGFRIPYWKETLKLIDEVARIIPDMRFIGWDVAIGEKEPIIIEGNQYPSNDIYQMPIHLKDGFGYLPRFQQIEKI